VVQGDIEEFLWWIIWARLVQATFSDLLRDSGKDTATAVTHKVSSCYRKSFSIVRIKPTNQELLHTHTSDWVRRSCCFSWSCSL